MREVGIPFGRYQLLRRLARGGMAEVFLARQTGLEGFDRLVAVKRVLPHLMDSREFVQMFLDEARLAAQLSHPNIVHIYEFGKVDEHYFIAMEWVDGIHAGQLIKRAETERLPYVVVARIGADACAGLHYAHEMRDGAGRPLELVHRDVSPANLIVSFDGTVKLVDFGIAKAVSSIEQTRPGVVKGKYAYMSPEQTVGRKLDGRSDVFSVSIVLWELLAGRVMVPREDPIEGMRMIRDDRLPHIADLRPDIPPALSAAIERGLANDKDERATALELGLLLESYIKSAPDGIGSSREVATWLRARFSRAAQTPDASIRDDSPGTRQVAEATGGVPAAEDSLNTNPSTDIPIVESSIVSSVVGATNIQTPTSSKWLPVGDGDDSVIVDRSASAPHAVDSPVTPDEVTLASLGNRFKVDPPLSTPRPTRARSDVRASSDDHDATGERDGDTVLDTIPFSRFEAHNDTEIDQSTRAASFEDRTALVPALSHAEHVSHVGKTLRPVVVRRGLIWLIAVVLLAVAGWVGWGMYQERLRPARAKGADRPAEPPSHVAPSHVGAEVIPLADAGAILTTPPVPLPVASPVLDVITKPAGASVTLSPGAQHATAPAHFNGLVAGTYVVEVTLDGYQSLSHQVILTPGERRTLELPLSVDAPPGRPGRDRDRRRARPASGDGTLTVRTRPYSEVFLGASKIGETPMADVALAPGAYTLVFKNPGYEPETRHVVIRSGANTKLDFSLQRSVISRP